MSKKERNVPKEDKDRTPDEATDIEESDTTSQTDAEVTVSSGGATASAAGIPTFSEDTDDGEDTDDERAAAEDGTAPEDAEDDTDKPADYEPADDEPADDVNDIGAAVAEDPFTPDDDDVPVELAGLRPTGDEPKTGLVSEFRDLKSNQAAWLVNNRDTSAVSRSPLFIVSVIVIGLCTLAALVIGFNHNKAKTDEATGGSTTLVTVGLGPQAKQAEQQLGVKINDVKSEKQARAAVRSGKATAALLQDPQSGSSTIIAKDKEPTALMDKLSGKPDVQLLNEPAVKPEVSSPMLWGVAALTIITFLTLGHAVFSTLRVEKRNRIAEVVAATIPPRAAARGRVNSTFTPALIYLLVAYVILLLGLSVLGFSTLVVSMLPGLGWLIGLHLAGTLIYPSLYLWAGSLAGKAARRVFYIIAGVVVVVGNFLPMFFDAGSLVTKVLGYIPFTAPVALTKLFFANNAEWWTGLVSLAIAVVVGLILLALAAAAYERNLLAGSGRAGKKGKAKKSKKLVTAGAAGGSAAGSADKESGDAESEGAESDDEGEAVDGDADAGSDDAGSHDETADGDDDDSDDESKK